MSKKKINAFYSTICKKLIIIQISNKNKISFINHIYLEINLRLKFKIIIKSIYVVHVVKCFYHPKNKTNRTFLRQKIPENKKLILLII